MIIYCCLQQFCSRSRVFFFFPITFPFAYQSRNAVMVIKTAGRWNNSKWARNGEEYFYERSIIRRLYFLSFTISAHRSTVFSRYEIVDKHHCTIPQILRISSTIISDPPRRNIRVERAKGEVQIEVARSVRIYKCTGT